MTEHDQALSLLIPTNKITVYAEAGRGDSNDRELDGLIQSIRAIGLLHPITISKDGDHWLCLAGARRLAAVRSLGWEQIPANIVDYGSDENALAISALENLDRKQLDPIDEATMCSAALQVLGDIDMVSAAIRRSLAWVQSRLDILGWPQDCIDALHAAALSMSAIAPLAKIADANVRDYYLTEAVANGATARQTAAWAAAWHKDPAWLPSDVAEPPAADGPPHLERKPPTAHCLICREDFGLNELSHLPMCTNCLDVLRRAATEHDLNQPKPEDRQNGTTHRPDDSGSEHKTEAKTPQEWADSDSVPLHPTDH